MKLSLDLHGVINDLPQVMRELTKAVIKDSGEVHILTGSTTIRAFEELEELGFEEGIHYTHVQGLPDLLKFKGCKVVGINSVYGNEEYSTEDWNSAKADYCRTNKIDLHLDDTVEYGETFTTPFARLWTKNK